MCEALWEPDLKPDELFETISQVSICNNLYIVIFFVPVFVPIYEKLTIYLFSQIIVSLDCICTTVDSQMVVMWQIIVFQSNNFYKNDYSIVNSVISTLIY